MTKEKLKAIARVMQKEVGSPHYIHDGVYDVSGLELLEVPVENFSLDILRDKVKDHIIQEILVFATKYPDFTVANAYATYSTVLLSGPPKNFLGQIIGSGGFNYGVNTVIKDCPSAILILAEND